MGANLLSTNCHLVDKEFTEIEFSAPLGPMFSITLYTRIGALSPERIPSLADPTENPLPRSGTAIPADLTFKRINLMKMDRKMRQR